MALKKEFDINNSGLKADYVRISSISLKRGKGTKPVVIVDCEVYKDQASRDADLNPITGLSFELDGENFEETVVPKFYKALKKMPALKGALDVPEESSS